MDSPAETPTTKAGIESEKPDLPPDGTPVYVSEWRREWLWLPVLCYIVFAVGMVGYWLSKAGFAALLLTLGVAPLVAVVVRIPISGLLLSSDGITVRSPTRTRHWLWEEVDGFSFDARRLPCLNVDLRDGTSVGAYGFYTQSAKARDRAQLLLAALERRREAELAQLAR